MIPQHIKLNEVAEIITGVAINVGVEGPYKYFYYQPNSFLEDGKVVELSTIARKEPISERQLVRIGDVLVKRLNPNFPLFVSEVLGDSIVSTNLYIIRGGSDIVPQYLALLFEQASVLTQISQLSGASSAIKAISAKKLMDITIPNLPKERQVVIGKWWELTKKRKQLLYAYMAETDRSVSAIIEKIFM